MTEFTYDRDQTRRSLKERLRSKFHQSFKHQPHTEFHMPVSTTASEYGSECSTLIDFVIDDSDTIFSTSEADIAQDDYLIHSDNQAWGSTSSSGHFSSHSSSRTRTFGVSAGFVGTGQDELLDEEDCSWVMPRKQASKPKRTFAVFCKRSRLPATAAGLMPELLEPEDCAWM